VGEFAQYGLEYPDELISGVVLTRSSPDGLYLLSVKTMLQGHDMNAD
jgi:hypothetical protein